MEEITARTPWEPWMGQVPMHLDYFQGSMFDAVQRIAQQYPDNVAYIFQGRSVRYPELVRQIERCARALKALGIREGDKVTIAMPNCPQALYLFYGVNRIGAIANMIHPLSAEKEIEFYLNVSDSKTAITLNLFYPKFARVLPNTGVEHLVIADIADELSPVMRVGYALKNLVEPLVKAAKKHSKPQFVPKVPANAPKTVLWKDFLAGAGTVAGDYAVRRGGEDPAVILYSGGTTGTTKGIVLTNLNFNALGQQVLAANPIFAPGDKMLAAMPLFHGFGLGVCVHTMLSQAGCCVLIPQFTAKTYAKDLLRHRCNFIAGVPTLYEALLRLKTMDGADLSCLKGVFSGGDSLSIELKKKFDKFLYDHKASIQVREGYGTTEAVTARGLTRRTKATAASLGSPSSGG